ncbi:hypothetical protein ACI3ET_11940 [Ornithinimicrobium sp. LYQ121]|uniref:hypothetical protein n=1 Tax=Ornithinimicrobium sp. LYQ121 TaxID=3378801 RepID=UPI0038542E1B
MDGSQGSKGGGFLAVVGVVVAAALLLGYLFATIGIMWTANDPPLLADPAPDSAPTLICVAGTDSARDDSDSVTEDDSAQATGGSQDEASTTSKAEPANSIINCPEDQIRLTPQYRGSFDPNTRLMALLAVIMPLLTTIVAFFFGQRAGAGEGKAETAALSAQISSLNPQQPEELTALQKRIKERGRS